MESPKKTGKGAKKLVTQREVFSLPDGLHRVAPCLFLRVQGDSRSYIFRFQKDGRRRDLGLGSAQDMTIAQAKADAYRIRAEVAAGAEIKGKHELNKEKRERKVIRLFSEVAEEAIETTRHVRKWKREKHEKRWRAIVETYAYPRLKNIPINQITRDDVVSVVQPIWETMTPTAQELRMILERIFAHAIFKGEYPWSNPAILRGNLDLILASASKIHTTKHHSAMTLEDSKKTCIKALECGSMSAAALVFGMLTALRAEEFIQAKWNEIDWEDKVFSVPPERRKVARDYPHRVPLSTQAVCLLQYVREFSTDSPCVFKSPKYGNRSVTRDSVFATLKRIAPTAATIHGFRSTFRVWAEETGQNTTAAEYQMMHENPSAVVRAYQRSDLLEQRRELMQRWADALLPMDVLKKTLGATPKPKSRNVPELEKIYGEKFKYF